MASIFCSIVCTKSKLYKYTLFRDVLSLLADDLKNNVYVGRECIEKSLKYTSIYVYVYVSVGEFI